MVLFISCSYLCFVDCFLYHVQPGTCRASDLIYTISAYSVQAAFPSWKDGSCTAPTLTIPDDPTTKYRATQLHLHVVSEHTMDGEYWDGELHMVHTSDDGQRLAVVAVLLNANAAANANNHSQFETLLQGWTAVQEESLQRCGIAHNSKSRRRKRNRTRQLERDASWDIHDLIPMGTTTTFYRYDGSLTTPPCSEIVQWNVADTALDISRNQYNRFVDFIATYRDPTSCELATVANPQDGSTNRPLQAQNGRFVHRICPTTFVEEEKSGQHHNMHFPMIVFMGITMGMLYLLYKTRYGRRPPHSLL